MRGGAGIFYDNAPAGLVDDLLSLSRWTRAEMRKERVDLSAMALSVAEELRQREPDRQVELIVQPGVIVGDLPVQ